MTTAHAFKELLIALAKRHFEVIHEQEDQAVVRSTELDATFVLTRAGEWVQAEQTLLERDALTDNARLAAAELALRIHSRFLGCRFAFDDDGSLKAVVDVFPGTSVPHLIVMLSQLAYIASTILPLFEEVREDEVDEERIEAAFREGGAQS